MLKNFRRNLQQNRHNDFSKKSVIPQIDPTIELSKYLKPYISHDIRVVNLSNEKILVEISRHSNKLEIFRWTKGNDSSRFKSIIKYNYPTSSQRVEEIIKYLKTNHYIGVSDGNQQTAVLSQS